MAFMMIATHLGPEADLIVKRDERAPSPPLFLNLDATSLERPHSDPPRVVAEGGAKNTADVRLS